MSQVTVMIERGAAIAAQQIVGEPASRLRMLRARHHAERLLDRRMQARVNADHCAAGVLHQSSGFQSTKNGVSPAPRRITSKR